MTGAGDLPGLKQLLIPLPAPCALRLFLAFSCCCTLRSLSHSIWLSHKMLLTKQVDRHGLIKITIFLPIYFISLLSSSSDAIMAIQHGRSRHSKIILLCPLLMKLFKKWDQHFQPYEGEERSGGHLKCAWKKERDVKMKREKRSREGRQLQA